MLSTWRFVRLFYPLSMLDILYSWKLIVPQWTFCRNPLLKFFLASVSLTLGVIISKAATSGVWPNFVYALIYSSHLNNKFVEVSFTCYCSVTKLCPTLCDPVNCSTPGFPDIIISWNSLKLMSIESVIPFNHLLCHPLLLPSIFLCIRVFSSESTLHIR